MKRISRDQSRKFAFDWRDKPLLLVECGESVEIETWDAGSGFFKSPDDKAIPANRPGFDKHPPLANPIGGPVFIEGAEPGDACAPSLTSMRGLGQLTCHVREAGAVEVVLMAGAAMDVPSGEARAVVSKFAW